MTKTKTRPTEYKQTTTDWLVLIGSAILLGIVLVLIAFA